MKNFLLFLFFIFKINKIKGIYEDQIGEYDWNKQHIGYLEHSLTNLKSMFVITSDNVLASINLRSGELDWRVLIPKETSIDQFVISKDFIFTLSKKNSIVQSWSIGNGEQQWIQKLPTENNNHHLNLESNNIQQLSYDSTIPTIQLGSLFIISQNCFFSISPINGNILNSFCPNTEIPTNLLTSKISNQQFLLTTILPLQDKPIYNKPFPILGGILKSKDSKEQQYFIVSIVVNNRISTIADISVYPNPAFDNLQDTTLSTTIYPFNQEKYFASTFNTNNYQLTISTYEKSTTSNVLIDLSHYQQSALNKYSINVLFTKFDVPLIELCTNKFCTYFTLEQVSNTNSSLKAKEVYSCEDNQLYVSYEKDYTHSKSDHIKNILCFKSSTSTSSNIEFSLLSPTSSDKYSVKHFSFSNATYSHLLKSPAHFTFSTYVSQISTDVVVKIISQNSLGTLSLIQQNKALKWIREESLSRVRQGIILDNTAILDTQGLTNIPNFKKRLELQVTDIKEKLLSLTQSIQFLSSGIKDVIYELLPPKYAHSLFPSYQASQKSLDVNVELFGFNKISIQLTSRCSIDGTSPLTSQNLDTCLNGLNVIALDLVDGSKLWSFSPSVISLIPKSFLLESQLFYFNANLLKVRLHSRADQPAELGLIISLEGIAIDGKKQSILLTYRFHALTGERIISQECSITNKDSTCKNLFENDIYIRTPDHVYVNTGHIISIQIVDIHISEKNHSTQHTEENYYQHSSLHYLLVHSSLDSTNIPTVSLFPPFSQPNIQVPGTLYTHTILKGQEKEGLFSYKINFNDYQTLQNEENNKLYLYSLQSIGNTLFYEQSKDEQIGERILSVTYPQPHETIHQIAKVLGDDSLLLKYLNPHMVVVVTERTKKTIQITEINTKSKSDSESNQSSEPESINTEVESSISDELFISIIDTVSAQIIYRVALINAAEPISVSLIEHTISVTYWNTKAQRYELNSIHLYEGMIGKYGLGPTSPAIDSKRSAFNSPPPIALQKSFILHRGVTAMHHTVTERGITNKNLLLGLSTGQILALDTRLIDPRRPLGAPSQLEKEEGLMQYMPFLMWSPLSMLTVNASLPEIHTILSTSSHLESTSLILSYGLDIYFTRATPSKGFDMLASDFNKPLLALIVGGMGILVLFLRSYNLNRLLKTNWQ